MFRFSDKTVYIISRERWGVMKISKHHYALALAERGCRVYFIEPPELSRKGVSIRECPDHPSIRIVNYRPVFRGKRFLPAAVFSILVRIQVRRLLKAIAQRPDVVLCFHGNLFEDLRRFGAPLNIFFAADHFEDARIPPELSSADLILAVSDTILRRIHDGGYPAHRINHGLNKAFYARAQQNLAKTLGQPLGRNIVVGYSGNLRIETIDRKQMLQVIRKHGECRFVFWGSYLTDHLNLYGQLDAQTGTFLEELIAQPNVVLRGPLKSEDLVEEMNGVDLLWLCWNFTGLKHRDNSNSHKILEYLSTGKPVISHSVLNYEGIGLLYMLPMDHAEEFPAFFSSTLARISEGEDPEIPRRRVEYALQNTYGKQLERIEALINGLEP